MRHYLVEFVYVLDGTTGFQIFTSFQHPVFVTSSNDSNPSYWPFLFWITLFCIVFAELDCFLIHLWSVNVVYVHPTSSYWRSSINLSNPLWKVFNNTEKIFKNTGITWLISHDVRKGQMSSFICRYVWD